MARTHDAQSALKALANHAELILDAHLNRGNRIPDTDENLSALETLEHHRLIWRFRGEEDQDPNLKKELIHLLVHVSGAQRRRWASEQVFDLWQSLEGLFRDYHEAKKRAAFVDIERLEAAIRECLAEIIDDIRSATEGFVSYLNSGFGYVTDLRLRIIENEKAIERAGKLNSLFDSFNIRELAEQAGNDPFLKRLLLKHLPAALEEGRQNLAYALNQLRVMLVQMREDQRLSKLIGAFEDHFLNSPGYIPSIADLDLEACPPALNNPKPFPLVAYGDIYDPASDQELIELAQSARSQPRQEAAPKEPERLTSIENDLDGHAETAEQDPLDELVQQLLDMVVSGNIGAGEISAHDTLLASSLDATPATFLRAVEAQVDALPPEDRRRVELTYDAVNDPLYPDNLYIQDITLRHPNVERV